MIVAQEDVASWSGSADVIVVGYGIAGVCAAIEARELGASVLVLERGSGCDGSTVYSGGLLYLGGGTAVQKACGFDDTPEAMAAYLNAITDASRQRQDRATFRRQRRAFRLDRGARRSVPTAPITPRRTSSRRVRTA